jgi:hypothetical protein
MNAAHEGSSSSNQQKDPVKQMVDLRAGLVDDAEDGLALSGHISKLEETSIKRMLHSVLLA